jgi:hypothetical protein
MGSLAVEPTGYIIHQKKYENERLYSIQKNGIEALFMLFNIFPLDFNISKIKYYKI